MNNKSNYIFISYRREDSAGVAGRIYDRLAQKFGKEMIFKDVDSIPLGINFKQHIDSVIKECGIVLVIIGDKWAGDIGELGSRRLDDPRDFVRIEIEMALARSIPVVPVLIQDAKIPSDDILPMAISELAYRNGINIRHDPHFHSDVDRLVKSIEALFLPVYKLKQNTVRPAQVASNIKGTQAPVEVILKNRESADDQGMDIPGSNKEELAKILGILIGLFALFFLIYIASSA